MRHRDGVAALERWWGVAVVELHGVFRADSVRTAFSTLAVAAIAVAASAFDAASAAAARACIRPMHRVKYDSERQHTTLITNILHSRERVRVRVKQITCVRIRVRKLRLSTG
jgi:hypothetical protein